MDKSARIEPVSRERINQFLETPSLHRNKDKVFAKLVDKSWLDVKWIVQSEVIKLVSEEFIVAKIAPHLISKKTNKTLRKAERLEFLTKLESEGVVWGWKYPLTQGYRFNGKANLAQTENFLIKYPYETIEDFNGRVVKFKHEVTEVSGDIQKLVQYYFCGPQLWFREESLNKNTIAYESTLNATFTRYINDFGSSLKSAKVIKWGVDNNAWRPIPKATKDPLIFSLFGPNDALCERGLLQGLENFEKSFLRDTLRARQQEREMRLWEAVRTNVARDERIVNKENYIKDLQQKLENANNEFFALKAQVEEEVKAHVRPLIENEDAMDL